MITSWRMKFRSLNSRLVFACAFPRKQRLAIPLFLFAALLGAVVIVVSLSAAFAENEARRDATAFGQGQYNSVAWFTFDQIDSVITRTDAAAKWYNEGIHYSLAYLNGVYLTPDDQGSDSSVLYSAAEAFQKAQKEALKNNDTEMVAKSSSALGAVLFLIALKDQNGQLADAIDAALVKALQLNPNDENASWNLEALRRLNSSSQGKQSKQNDNRQVPLAGPGGLDPGKGGL